MSPFTTNDFLIYSHCNTPLEAYTLIRATLYPLLHPMKILLIILGSLLVIWILWSYFGTSNVEKPKIVASKMLTKAIEIRTFAPMIQAVVTVTGSQSQAINNGFRQLAGYIFGGNTVQKPVAMTAPVALSEASDDATSIAMTAPVATQQEGGTYRVSFMMPSKYTLATLPKPNNGQISFVELPSKTYYVWRFS